jgi:hypothetical protein
MKSFKESIFLAEQINIRTLKLIYWIDQQERLFNFDRSEIINEVIKKLKENINSK